MSISDTQVYVALVVALIPGILAFRLATELYKQSSLFEATESLSEAGERLPMGLRGKSLKPESSKLGNQHKEEALAPEQAA